MSTGTPTKEETLAWATTSLRETVGRLAADPSEQIAYLQELGTYPVTDELALEFHDAFLLADQLVEAGRLAPDLYRRVSRIDKLLDDLSDGAEANWLPEALESDPRWAKVREIARTVAPCL
jgi:hypothetical protein